MRKGYAKSGKSLKAIKRYYALKNTGKGGKKDGEKPQSPDQSKSKRPKDEDNISKRIAAELKAQKDVSEKRGVDLEDVPDVTERPGPLDASKKADTGPVFVTGAKSPALQSAKSIKSVGTVFQVPDDNFSYTSLGFAVACILMGFIYIITWCTMFILLKTRPKPLTQKEEEHSSLSSIQWLALSSIPVVLSITDWLWARSSFRHAIATLLALSLGTVSVFIYVVLNVMMAPTYFNDQTQKKMFDARNPLNFWLPLVYFVYLVVVTTFMIRQACYVVSVQRSGDKTLTQSLNVSEVYAPV